MKTILPERSLVIKPLFDQVTFKILTVRKDTMFMHSIGSDTILRLQFMDL